MSCASTLAGSTMPASSLSTLLTSLPSVDVTSHPEQVQKYEALRQAIVSYNADPTSADSAFLKREYPDWISDDTTIAALGRGMRFMTRPSAADAPKGPRDPLSNHKIQLLSAILVLCGQAYNAPAPASDVDSTLAARASALHLAVSLAQTGRPQEHCFHIVRRWLRSRSGLEPVPVCPVCRTAELEIRGIAPLSPHSRLASAVVLPCTHMVCAPCQAEIEDTAQSLECPMCREPFCATRCGHECAISLPGGDAKEDEEEWDFGGVKLTAEGEEMPNWCSECQDSRLEEGEREDEDYEEERPGLFGDGEWNWNVPVHTFWGDAESFRELPVRDMLQSRSFRTDRA